MKVMNGILKGNRLKGGAKSLFLFLKKIGEIIYGQTAKFVKITRFTSKTKRKL
jgi:hypothetical protein